MSAEATTTVILGRRVLLEEGIVPAAIIIDANGVISEIVRGDAINDISKRWKSKVVIDAGDDVVLPGGVDSHVHINEPGRTEWEGFWTATRAAAKGGITTLVDMPLNSVPPTTTLANLNKKLKSTEGQLHVDVAFWGGLVPSNQDSLLELVAAGVVGFKCFLCHSGVDEFPGVKESHVRGALDVLRNTDAVLAFHAELEEDITVEENKDASEYGTFLGTRPPTMETSAVDLVCQLCTEYNVRCHIVHASASGVVERASSAKAAGAPLTLETCFHYLSFTAEDVPRGQTTYKCCPPIRAAINQESLWSHLEKGEIDIVVSDHSPCPPDMKGDSDFLAAWGGISSVQFGLSALWTAGAPRGLSLPTLSRLVSAGPAQLCRLTQKGSLSVGKDADLIVFDPDAEWTLKVDDILHKHKHTPYLGRQMRGRVLRTMLRGKIVYSSEEAMPPPQGKVLLLKK